MKKVTGLGGVFFKFQAAGKMNDWYAKNLGVETSPYGTSFYWREMGNPEKTALRYGVPSRRIRPTLIHPVKIL